MNRLKSFKSFDELSTEEREKFVDYKGLNSLIETDNIGYMELVDSYEKIILGEKESDCELDFQIKCLIEEIRVPINQILIFADRKFVSISTKLREYFEGACITPLINRHIKEILEVKKGYYVVRMYDKFGLGEEIKIPFAFDKTGRDIEIELKAFGEEVAQIKYKISSKLRELNIRNISTFVSKIN